MVAEMVRGRCRVRFAFWIEAQRDFLKSVPIAVSVAPKIPRGKYA